MRLTVLQSPGALAGVAARLNWLAQTLTQLVPTDLVLLPELFACGYHIGSDVAERAEPADGPIARQMAALAKRFGLTLHYGFAEAAAGRVYNSAQAIGPDGASLTLQRKLAIPPGWERAQFQPGRGAPLFRCAGLQVGTLICYDAEFPEAVRHLAARGAQLVLVPTALSDQWGPVARQMMPTRAFENGVFLAYANHAGSERGMPYLGESVICAPEGRDMARAGVDPAVLTAVIDAGAVEAAQTRLPYLRDRQGLWLD